MFAEIAGLRQEVARLKQEKIDLQLLIETNIEHSDRVTEDLFEKMNITKQNLLTKIISLSREVSYLHEEVTNLKREKTDLEMMIEMNIEHSDHITEDLIDKVELTLIESEKRFRMICETIPVPILVTRLSDFRIVYANMPTGDFFGFPESGLSEFLDGRQKTTLSSRSNLKRQELLGALSEPLEHEIRKWILFVYIRFLPSVIVDE